MPRTIDPDITRKNTSEVSLRKYIILPFAVLFISTVVFLCWFSYISAQKTIKEFQQAIAEEISQGVSTQLKRFFSVTAAVVQVNSDFERVGRLDTTSKVDLEKHFLSQISNLPHLNFISYGTVNGDYVGATRSPDNSSVRIMKTTDKEHHLSIFNVDKNFNLKSETKTGRMFNTTDLTWFIAAAEKGTMTWYPVYSYLPYDGMGIGVAAPLFDKSKKLKGVLMADMSLKRISEYLKTLDLGKHGFIYITDMDDKMIGSTLDEPAYYKDNGEVIRYSVTNYPDKRIKTISGFNDIIHSPVGNKFFSLDNDTYLINKNVYTDPFGLKLNIWIVISQGDYSAHFEHNLKTAIIVVLFAALLGWLVIIKISDYLAKPIQELNRHVDEISTGNLNSVMDSGSNVTEIKQLSESFNTMAAKLSESFANLEHKIEERTSELNIANKKLLELSITDELTKTANRRHFNEVLSKEWSHSSRSQTPMTLLMLDIDFFKNYNDHYGHQAGDECLKNVANVIKSNVKRQTDLTARYGGEEFAVIMPNTDKEYAPKIAEDIRKALEKCKYLHEKSPFGIVTISIGYATVTANEKESAEELIHKADTALYAAKTSGRNKIFG